MSAVDWLVLVASLVGIVGYGLLRSRGEWSVHAYVSAGKQMRWWVIGLSIMATQASAITFIGTTSQGFADGLRFVQFYFGLPVAMVLISAYAAPAFHRSGVRTAYEYWRGASTPRRARLRAGCSSFSGGSALAWPSTPRPSCSQSSCRFRNGPRSSAWWSSSPPTRCWAAFAR